MLQRDRIVQAELTAIMDEPALLTFEDGDEVHAFKGWYGCKPFGLVRTAYNYAAPRRLAQMLAADILGGKAPARVHGTRGASAMEAK